MPGNDVSFQDGGTPLKAKLFLDAYYKFALLVRRAGAAGSNSPKI
jgi:hypothetical protein